MLTTTIVLASLWAISFLILGINMAVMVSARDPFKNFQAFMATHVLTIVTMIVSGTGAAIFGIITLVQYILTQVN